MICDFFKLIDIYNDVWKMIKFFRCQLPLGIKVNYSQYIQV